MIEGLKCLLGAVRKTKSLIILDNAVKLVTQAENLLEDIKQAIFDKQEELTK